MLLSICGALAKLAKPKPKPKEEAKEEEESDDIQPGVTPHNDWNEEDYAAQIVRDVETEVTELKDQVADLDLLRELILQKLTFSFKGGDSAEETAEKRKALYGATEGSDTTEGPKRRGRPPGSKNKSKEPTETPAASEPVVESKPGAPAAPTPRAADVPTSEAIAANNDLTIPDYLRR